MLDKELDRRGVYPPVKVLPSLSRLMDAGIGAGYTHADHPALANQLFAAYARANRVRLLASVMGREGLSRRSRRYLRVRRCVRAPTGPSGDRGAHSRRAWPSAGRCCGCCPRQSSRDSIGTSSRSTSRARRMPELSGSCRPIARPRSSCARNATSCSEGYEFLDEKRMLLAAEILRGLERYQCRTHRVARAPAARRRVLLLDAAARHGLDALIVYPVHAAREFGIGAARLRRAMGIAIVEARGADRARQRQHLDGGRSVARGSHLRRAITSSCCARSCHWRRWSAICAGSPLSIVAPSDAPARSRTC